jgi:hypothetical protein
MKHKMATTLLMAMALVMAILSTVVSTPRPALAAGPGTAWPIDGYAPNEATDNAILRWDEQLLGQIRLNPGGTGPTVTARALAILHTATYDAWAAYDPVAVGTQLGGALRRPPNERNNENKDEAISYAAYRVLLFLFPNSSTTFRQYMLDHKYPPDDMGDYNPNDLSVIPTTARGIGNLVARKVIDYRSHDGANQLGDDPRSNGKPYSDTTGYRAAAPWDAAPKQWHWQQLCVTNPNPPTGATLCSVDGALAAVQGALTPQWRYVTPFGLNPQTHYPALYQPPGPPKLADGNYDPADIDTALGDTANLNETQKVRAAYWADGPRTEFPPGHMAVFAQAMSRMKGNSLDNDAKLFFALGNALLDASIAAWEAKYTWDFWRPITAIRYRYNNKTVTSWLGPGKGYGKVLGQNWKPYQETIVVTPPFPEYVSGHSTFSAAGRLILNQFFGSDWFSAKVTVKAGSSKIEPNTPAKDVVLQWKTLSDTADDAGWSRRWGGIHFKSGDEHGRGLGRVIGYEDWNKALTYFNPPTAPTTATGTP